MSDNWIVSNLESALSGWNEKLSEIWTLLTQSPETFKGGTVWSMILTINNALVENDLDAAWKLVRGGKMAGFVLRGSMNWVPQCRDAEAFSALLAYANAQLPGVPALIREEHVKHLPGPLNEHFKLTLMQYGDAFPPPEASFGGFLPDIG